MSLSKFPEMLLPSYTCSPLEEALIIQHELDYDIDDQFKIVNTNIPLLNADLLRVFDSVISTVNDTELYPKVLFGDGPGSTGKTLLYNTILAKVRLQSQIAHFVWREVA